MTIACLLQIGEEHFDRSLPRTKIASTQSVHPVGTSLRENLSDTGNPASDSSRQAGYLSTHFEVTRSMMAPSAIVENTSSGKPPKITSTEASAVQWHSSRLLELTLALIAGQKWRSYNTCISRTACTFHYVDIQCYILTTKHHSMF